MEPSVSRYNGSLKMNFTSTNYERAFLQEGLSIERSYQRRGRGSADGCIVACLFNLSTFLYRGNRRDAREMLLNAAASLELFKLDFHFHFFRKSFNIEAGCIGGDLRLRLKV